MSARDPASSNKLKQIALDAFARERTFLRREQGEEEEKREGGREDEEGTRGGGGEID